MVDPALFAGFVLACILLMLSPGPNVALIVATSLAHGPRQGLLVVAGTASAMVVQLVLAAAGLAALLAGLGPWIESLRWLGVAWLVWLGLSSWLAAPVGRAAPCRHGLLRGFAVSMLNPKTLLFYAAFLPQFIAPAHPVLPQMASLSATFLAIAVLIDPGWAVLADRAGRMLSSRAAARLSSFTLLAAALLLALARIH